MRSYAIVIALERSAVRREASQELKRFREREPLVQALLDIALDPDSDDDAAAAAIDVRDFKIGGE